MTSYRLWTLHHPYSKDWLFDPSLTGLWSFRSLRDSDNRGISFLSQHTCPQFTIMLLESFPYCIRLLFVRIPSHKPSLIASQSPFSLYFVIMFMVPSSLGLHTRESLFLNANGPRIGNCCPALSATLKVSRSTRIGHTLATVTLCSTRC